ncbi:MAG: DUF1080 domain-containing protein [Planctomycetaceae bacterium]|nr:DUF1080 domain-containing protein [Planctomycetaceae bacterium]
MRTVDFCLLTVTLILCTDSIAQAQQTRPQGMPRVVHRVPIFVRPTVMQTFAMPGVAIFNGETLDGWTTVSGSTDIKAWEAVDGTLHRKSGGGDIVTEQEYENFILDFEWKISPGGNSGVKYKFANFDGSWLGCEYQVIDDETHSDGMLKTHRTASLYDVIAPRVEAAKPIGEYNKSRVVVNGKRIQHYLNGKLTVDVIVGSPEWEKGFQASKFRDHEEFGKIAQGKILVQDHGDEVWYKNMVVRELKTMPVRKAGPLQRLGLGGLFR